MYKESGKLFIKSYGNAIMKFNTSAYGIKTFSQHRPTYFNHYLTHVTIMPSHTWHRMQTFDRNRQNTLCKSDLLPCSLGYLFVLAPIHHPSHHPSHQVSWHQDQGCVVACPNPLVFCHQDHQFFPYHPSHLVSLLQDPIRICITLVTLFFTNYWY